MMKLIMEWTAQLKNMEIEMEKMVKEKEQATKTSIVPLEVVPLTTIPTSITSTTSIGEAADQLAKSVENMSLQTEEIKNYMPRSKSCKIK